MFWLWRVCLFFVRVCLHFMRVCLHFSEEPITKLFFHVTSPWFYGNGGTSTQKLWGLEGQTTLPIQGQKHINFLEFSKSLNYTWKNRSFSKFLPRAKMTPFENSKILQFAFTDFCNPPFCLTRPAWQMVPRLLDKELFLEHSFQLKGDLYFENTF